LLIDMDGMQRSTNTSQQSTITIYLAVTSHMYNEVKTDRRRGRMIAVAIKY
jgi:hypothetical protein